MAKIAKLKDVKNGYIVYIEKPKNFNFKEGQYVYLIVNEEKKPFSVVKEENGYLVFYIKNKEFVEKIKDKNLEIKGPFGKFDYEKLLPFKKIIYIVAGSGIAPVIGVLKKLKDKENIVIYQERTEDDLVFTDEIEEYAKLVKVLSKEQNRHVQDILNNFIDKEAAYLIVGPNSFTKEIKEILINNGIKEEQIFFAY